MSGRELALIFSVWGIAVVILWLRFVHIYTYAGSQLRRVQGYCTRLAQGMDTRTKLRKPQSLPTRG